MRKILETCKDIGFQLALCDAPMKSKGKSPGSQNMLMASLEEPEILPWYKPCHYVKTLSELYEKLESEDPLDQAEKWMFYVELSFLFRGLGERRSLKRCLRSARQHAPSRQQELVLNSWLKYERRGEELDELHPVSKSKLWNAIPRSPTRTDELSTGELDPVNSDVAFLVHGERIPCIRKNFGSLSLPFYAMLFGDFKESSSSCIRLTDEGLSVDGMKVVERFSRTGKLGDALPDVIIEIMSFCRVYLCDGLRMICDRKLASMVHTLQDAVIFMEIALQQSAEALLAACMGVFLAELPHSLKNPYVANLFCTDDGKRKLKATGYYSFTLYCLLSQACLEEDIASEMTMRMLLRAKEFPSTDRRKVLVNHQLGCSMLAAGFYKEAYSYFHAAVDAGHDYSLAGFTRVKYKRGFTLSACTEATFTIETHKPRGWMYQERSLYRVEAQEKLSDLNAATELDPTLTYPYKYRAALLVEQKKMQEALAEISRVLVFRMTPDCLEFRVYVSLTMGDYRAAVRDLRVILAIDPTYKLYRRRVEAGKLLKLLSGHVSQMSKADCWLKLYDCWSAIDDVGSLAVVHQMLEEGNGPKGTLLFRLSSLLLRMNCPKAALHNLKLARDSTDILHEKLVYEGWLLFDTGHREEALRKAEESIAIQRSFEAFFLKSFILQEMPSDPTSGRKAIGLLEEALKCPSDGLRKGQALNNMGNLYTDAENLDMAVECFTNAIKIRHARAHQGLAKVYAIRGDKRAAFNEMTKLIQKVKKNAEVHEKRALYGDGDMLVADLAMASKIDPMRSNPYKMRAAILADEDDFHHAVRELTKAIDLKVDIQLVHVRAAFHESAMQLFDALRDCRAALAIDPKHPETLAVYERIKTMLEF